MNSPPLWLALLGSGIAALAAVMAVAQWRTNHQKVVLDLFDRRFAIFEETSALISRIHMTGNVTDVDFKQLYRIRAKARFLFGPEIFDFLETVLHTVTELNKINKAVAMARDNKDAAKSLDTVIKQYPAQHPEYLGILNDQLTKFPYLLELYMKMDQKRVPFAMNYRRGFFRAWVLLTVLWIGGVAFMSGPDVYREFREVAAIDAAMARVSEAEARRGEPLKPEELPPEANPFLRFDYDPWGSLAKTGALALLPPLTLLALGAALGWVFSGFRRQV
jgi:hypothetical protein